MADDELTAYFLIPLPLTSRSGHSISISKVMTKDFVHQHQPWAIAGFFIIISARWRRPIWSSRTSVSSAATFSAVLARFDSQCTPGCWNMPKHDAASQPKHCAAAKTFAQACTKATAPMKTE